MVHTLGIAADNTQETAVVLLVLERSVLERFDIGKYRCERGAKFVRDVRQELLTDPFEPLEAGDVVKDPYGQLLLFVFDKAQRCEAPDRPAPPIKSL